MSVQKVVTVHSRTSIGFNQGIFAEGWKKSKCKRQLAVNFSNIASRLKRDVSKFAFAQQERQYQLQGNRQNGSAPSSTFLLAWDRENEDPTDKAVASVASVCSKFQTLAVAYNKVPGQQTDHLCRYLLHTICTLKQAVSKKSNFVRIV